MKSKLIPSLLAGALLIGLAGTATAGTTSTTFNAGVTINQACEVAGTPVDFGSLDIVAVVTDAPESIKHDSLLPSSPTPAPTVTVTVTASPGSTSGGGTPSSTPTTSATSSATSTSRKTP